MGPTCSSLCQFQMIKTTFKYLIYFTLIVGIILAFRGLSSSEEVEHMTITLNQKSNGKLENIPQNPKKIEVGLMLICLQSFTHAEKVKSTHAIDSETLRILFLTKWCSDVW